MNFPATAVLLEGGDNNLKTHAATVGPLLERACGKLIGRSEVAETVRSRPCATAFVRPALRMVTTRSSLDASN
jgi:hypothetical protein